MDYTFGKQLEQIETKTGKVIGLRVLFAFAAIIFLLTALGITFNFQDMNPAHDPIPVPLLVIIYVAAALMVGVFVLVKKETVTIFEKGVVLEKRNKETRIAFDEIESVIDAGELDSSGAAAWAIGGLVGFLVHEAVTGGSGTSAKKLNKRKNTKNRTITLNMKEGKNHTILRNAGSSLSAAIAAYTFEGVTAENINQLDISFGKELEFSQGYFKLETRKHQKQVHLSQISSIKFADGSAVHFFSLDSSGEEVPVMIARLSPLTNIDSLIYIIDNFTKKAV
ncbi:MAG: hypothetical protein FWC69_02795 [Defluviitaleaceae bacterium]|nr:hypothetical protein [Defluviitaleaceae bacterium]